MEMEQPHHTLSEINNGRITPMITNHQIYRIHIITDSQNCMKNLKHETYLNDDALMQSYRRTKQQLVNLENNKQFQAQIHTHCVRRHDKSTYNNEVDGFARISAATLLYTSNNNSNCHCKGFIKPILSNIHKP